MTVMSMLKGRIANSLGFDLPVRILVNRRGKYYLGTFHEEHGRISRESVETWDKQYQAEEALANNNWHQKEINKYEINQAFNSL